MSGTLEVSVEPVILGRAGVELTIFQQNLSDDVPREFEASNGITVGRRQFTALYDSGSPFPDCVGDIVLKGRVDINKAETSAVFYTEGVDLNIMLIKQALKDFATAFNIDLIIHNETYMNSHCKFWD